MTKHNLAKRSHDSKQTASQFLKIPYKILVLKCLNDSDRVLFGFLGSLQKKRGFCYASNEYICRELDWSKTKLKAGLTKLEKLGMISRRYEAIKPIPFGRKIFINNGTTHELVVEYRKGRDLGQGGVGIWTPSRSGSGPHNR